MGWLHIWSGLLVGWVLFFIFVTGVAGYFDTEIDRWMQPERPLAAAPALRPALEIGLARLQQQAPNAEQWTIYPPSGHIEPDLRISWRDRSGENRTPLVTEVLDATGKPIVTRDTGGGQLLYQMHYRLHYMPSRVAHWIVGVCAMFMLIAIVSGVITHKRIFKDFYTFRPAKGQRSWLDAHNVVSVIALPFFLMITYSGLVFYMFTYMSPIVSVEYGAGDIGREAFFDQAYPDLPYEPRLNSAAPLAPLWPMIIETQHQGESRVLSVSIRHPGDRNARVVVSRQRNNPQNGADQMIFDGASGRLLATEGPRRFSARKANDVLIGLHEGLFAGPLLRALYFLAGVLGCAMIATGLVLWTVKRRQKAESGQPAPGLALVERLNIATIAGLPLGIAAYFWSNRLLPIDLPDRAAWEANALFCVWGLSLAYAWTRPLARAWVELLGATAAAYALLPLLNALTTDRHLGVTLPYAIKHGDWALAGVDLVFFALGAGLAYTALKTRIMLQRSQRQTSRSAHSFETTAVTE